MWKVAGLLPVLKSFSRSFLLYVLTDVSNQFVGLFFMEPWWMFFIFLYISVSLRMASLLSLKVCFIGNTNLFDLGQGQPSDR